MAGSGTYFKFNVPPPGGGGGGGGGSFAECRGEGMVLEGGRGGEAGNFNRRDITGNAAGWELGGAIFLKNASRCKFALQLLAPRLLILPLSG